MAKIHGASAGMIFITATDIASTDSDKLSVKEFSIEKTISGAEVEEIGTVLKYSVAGHTSISVSCSGETDTANTVLALVRNASLSGATIYVTVLWDPAASANSKGARYDMFVESFSEKGTSGGLTSFDAKFALAGPSFTAV
jgi:hypothetical protein